MAAPAHTPRIAPTGYHMRSLQKTYRFRLYPTKSQEEHLYQQAGACRWVWNWALARRNEYLAQTGNPMCWNLLSRELTALKRKPETAWLNQVCAASLQQTLRQLKQAFDRFFSGTSRFPKFKSRKRSNPSFKVVQDVMVVNNRIWATRIFGIRTRHSYQMEGRLGAATFKRDACGHWYVTIISHFESPDVALPIPSGDDTVGVDVGLKNFLVLSTGESEPAPKFLRKMQKKLTKAQRAFCRRQSGSNRQEKARKRIAQVNRKIVEKRKDFLHKLSTRIVNQFSCVCIEDLNLAGLAKTKLAKSFNDAAHGSFRQMLEYKSLWYQKHFVKVGKLFPSTKTCSVCGEIINGLTLSDRTWTCLNCGTTHNRDLNAASNIKAEGLRLLALGHRDSNARGASVRPSRRRAVGCEASIPSLFNFD